jgi:hypothetical protein
MANELIVTNAAALAALVDKTTGDTLTAAEYTTLKDSVQEANVATRTANTVFAGPTTGAAAAPTFRALVAADIPSLSAVYQPLDATLTALAALGAGPGFLQVTGPDTFAIAALTDTQINTALGYTAANAAALNPANLSAAVPTTKGGTGLTAIGTALQVLRVNAGATALEFADAAGGITGVVSDAATNTVSDALVIQHATSGTAAAGFGTGLLWQGENAAGTMRDMASIDAVYDSAVNGAETTRLDFRTYLAGAEATPAMSLVYATNQAILSAPVNFTVKSLAGFAEIYAGGANPIYLSTNGTLRWSVSSTGHIEPATTNTYDIGTSSLLVRKLYAITSGVQTANGAESNVKTISESITLNTGGLTTDSTADLLPANSIILAVTARITTQITTTTDWALGDATTAARFAAANATLTAGTTSVGLAHQQGSVATDATGPVQIAAAKLRITCSGANPGAGAVRVTVTYLELTPPTS